MKKYTTREKADLAAKLARLCVKVTEKTKADAFFEFSPHVNWFEVRIYPEGWDEGCVAKPKSYLIGFEPHLGDPEVASNKALKDLEGLLQGAK